MECCAEVQKCNMDNKFYNLQKDKYGEKLSKNVGKTVSASKAQINDPPDEGLLQENVWLNAKVEELQ